MIKSSGGPDSTPDRQRDSPQEAVLPQSPSVADATLTGRDDEVSYAAVPLNRRAVLLKPTWKTFLATAYVSIYLALLVWGLLAAGITSISGLSSILSGVGESAPVSDGCVMTNSIVTVNVDEPKVLTVEATPGGCLDFNSGGVAPTTNISRPVLVGKKVEVALIPSGAPVQIEARTSQMQPIYADLSNTWQWTVTAKKPGFHNLAVSIRAMDEEGRNLLRENPPIDINVNAVGGVTYYLGVGWSGASTFFITLNSVLTAALGAFAALGGKRYMRWRSQRRNGTSIESSDIGYI